MTAFLIFIFGLVSGLSLLLILPIIGMSPAVVLQIGNQRFIAKFLSLEWDEFV